MDKFIVLSKNLNDPYLERFSRGLPNAKLIDQNNFDYDEESASNLDWFYHLTGGVTHTDFFAIRPTDYSKAGEDDDWDEDSLF